jgi:hypothetical protein
VPIASIAGQLNEPKYSMGFENKSKALKFKWSFSFD